ncbi:Hypp7313 [Branchiostoma lanceolatum]|uniref:Hypp7313 protein n=1 Tax=Branchiostoma lanceolatum TaxID=7740 RepID=A0A8K0ECU5_BRALA|nr:Hypp7313 [Branchiostoma lanceolatum]
MAEAGVPGCAEAAVSPRPGRAQETQATEDSSESDGECEERGPFRRKVSTQGQLKNKVSTLLNFPRATSPIKRENKSRNEATKLPCHRKGYAEFFLYDWTEDVTV